MRSIWKRKRKDEKVLICQPLFIHLLILMFIYVYLYMYLSTWQLRSLELGLLWTILVAAWKSRKKNEGNLILETCAFSLKRIFIVVFVDCVFLSNGREHKISKLSYAHIYSWENVCIWTQSNHLPLKAQWTTVINIKYVSVNWLS